MPSGSTPVLAPESVQTPNGDGAIGNDQLGPDLNEPRGVATNVTPSGIEVYYQAGPKRLYRVRWAENFDHLVEVDPGMLVDCGPRPYQGMHDWIEVPSVSTILGVLDKSGPLTWWGQGIGGIGALKLQSKNVDLTGVHVLLDQNDDDGARKALCDLLTANKLSTNHVVESAGDRGTNTHNAFETWAGDQRITPQPIVFPLAERGYVAGLASFLSELSVGGVSDIEAEVMVGSLVHGYAGRYDLRLTLAEPVEVTTRVYPKKAPERETIPAGKILLDLKTSKSCYPTHALQLAAYEAASVECGYSPTDYQAVIHVTAGGLYELRRVSASIDEFASVLACYQTMQKKDSEWFA